MNDRGVELLKPQYGQHLLVAADTAYWEVLYSDGTVLTEAAGAKYNQIDRSKLAAFRIIYQGENVFETFPPAGATGHNLVYRRRSSLGTGSDSAGRGVLIICGWAPHGPIFAINLDDGIYAEDTAGLLPTLTPVPGEPDDILLTPA